MDRRRMLHIFKTARECGNYDELPVLTEQFDVQMHLSRNDRPQPFHLICDHDTLLIQMSGEGRVEFKESSILYYSLEAGDFIYVPAGTPHRVVPETESVQVRLKLLHPRAEGLAWYCQACGRQLWREEWLLADEFSQEAFVRASRAFNVDESKRRCSNCGEIHPTVDVDDYRWESIGSDLRAEALEAAPA